MGKEASFGEYSNDCIERKDVWIDETVKNSKSNEGIGMTANETGSNEIVLIGTDAKKLGMGLEKVGRRDWALEEEREMI